MTLHIESSPLANSTVTIKFAGKGHFQIDPPGQPPQTHEFVVEDYWDKLMGKSWMDSDGNPAALMYAIRCGTNNLPIDDEVLYGKIGAFGHLVHVSEIQQTQPQTTHTDEEEHGFFIVDVP